tara:strand:- start:389 stop:643 length:255 start_codon:yes stop_codon:yes gene_type:complete
MSKKTKDELIASRIILSVFAGFICGALYITFIGNIPIMPDLAYAMMDSELLYIIAWILYPIPFFPVIFGVAYLVYSEAFPIKDQ